MRLQAQFNKLTAGSPYKFVESLVKILISDKETHALQEGVDTTYQLLQRTEQYENKVLNLDGTGERYQHAAEISRRVRELVLWLEDILCVVMGNSTELSHLFYSQKLLYQSM
jgi:hypothetical protein